MRKALIAGAVAGIAASVAMKLSDELWQKVYPGPSYEDDITELIAGRHATAAHMAIGTALGIGYSVAVELFPHAAKAGGIPFFVGEAVIGNELIGPKLGLFKPASEYPASKHWNSVLTHVVYGAVAELVRSEVRKRL
jgi:putative membrane protein